ncbi:hypothetical protein [Hydrocoleum sp. CS-953]|uniref:hypothetical protein n=1 Tax=Hydrocoleum sp. CS-953 TaxID=1671698 RepID=UPI001AEFEFBB|nr:hypothetical protein [Hydrocoleum sp. CS-953]
MWFSTGWKERSPDESIFSGASENENVCGFPLRWDGWKYLTRVKQLFTGSSIR